MKGRNLPVDISVHVRRKDGKKISEKEARAALWAAHKLVQSGKSLTALKEWDIKAVNWRVGGRSYRYSGGDVEQALIDMGGILETVGMSAIRAGVPDSGPEDA